MQKQINTQKYLEYILDITKKYWQLIVRLVLPKGQQTM